jgi:hypothetical protein
LEEIKSIEKTIEACFYFMKYTEDYDSCIEKAPSTQDWLLFIQKNVNKF